jgi:hypothetical protein
MTKLREIGNIFVDNISTSLGKEYSLALVNYMFI